MGDSELVERVDDPVTQALIAADLRDLGVESGDDLLVHSSLRAIGWIAGGAQAVVEGVRDAVTDFGTVVVPTHTPQYTDPAGWENPPVPEDWVETIQEAMPPFRPDVTPSYGVGVIPECLRGYPEAVRSAHPVFSFAAIGANADAITSSHELDNGLGEGSPLARLYERDGKVLLLGVGHDSNTSVHLAEYRADVEKRTVTDSVPVLRDGERVIVEREDVELDSDDFPEVGAAFEREIGLAEGSVGAATAKLIDQPSLVDFAVEWFETNR